MARRYLNNKDLMVEIHRSKITYGSYTDPAFHDFDVFASDLCEVVEPGIRYRLTSVAHIPFTDDKSRQSKSPVLRGRIRTNFTPYSHFILADGQPLEVGRSHWQGGFDSGGFSTTHGRVTARLGSMFMKLVEEIGRRPNWRSYSYLSEMQSAALVHLCAEGLRFDESKGDNPFGYYTQLVKNCFLKYLSSEKRQQAIKDETRFIYGLPSSWASRDDY